MFICFTHAFDFRSHGREIAPSVKMGSLLFQVTEAAANYRRQYTKCQEYLTFELGEN